MAACPMFEIRLKSGLPAEIWVCPPIPSSILDRSYGGACQLGPLEGL